MMGVRKLWLAAVGFSQAAGFGDSVLAQGSLSFGDPLCTPETMQAQCVDQGCQALNPPFTVCENTMALLDAYRCVPTGQLCTTDADCGTGSCQTVAEATIDGCRCVHHDQPPVKCAVVQDIHHGGQLCADFNCRSTMPGFRCDPTTCNCVPEPPPTQTVPPTTVTTATTSTTTTTTLMVVDHLKCYKIKDPNKLIGKIDLNSPQFGVEPGCRIAKTRRFCVPVKKTVISATVNGAVVTPAPIAGQNLVDDYVCYTILCSTPPPASAKVQDQFSTRTLTKFKASEVCVPARKVP